jgi:putative transposase
MVMQEYSYFEIRDVLQVAVGFISKYKQLFKEQGIAGLTLKHQGSTGDLDPSARLAVIEWLHCKNYWISELEQHVLDTYNVTFASLQSDYDLFTEAGISWNSTQKRHPKLDQFLVKKQEITNWLDADESEIGSGLAVFLLDECHLLWGDICGYVWGKKKELMKFPLLMNGKNRPTMAHSIFTANSF